MIRIDTGFTERISSNANTFNLDLSNESRVSRAAGGREVIHSSNEYLSASENHLNDLRLKKQSDFAKKLVKLIKNQYFEYGVTSEADRLVEAELKKNTLATKNTINRIFIENFSTPQVIVGLLQVISRIPEAKIYPEGHTITTAALSHKDVEVQECAIRCFENWNSVSAIRILKNTNLNPDWLRKYADLVIKYIQG